MSTFPNQHRFTYYQNDRDGMVNLLAGDTPQCIRCGSLIFRDWAFLEDQETETRDEPTSASGQIACGREELASSALAADPGDRVCEYCTGREETILADRDKETK